MKKKKQSKHGPSPASSSAPVTGESETVHAIPEPVEQPIPETAAAAAPGVRTPRAVDPRTFSLTGQEFKPGKGLATELHKALRELGAATAQQVADALLASGEYARVAPQAAKLRPTTPVETLLKRWLAQGAVTAA